MKSRIPQGFGGGGSMQSMMKQAQKMQEDMTALQEELDAKEYEIKAGGGVVQESSSYPDTFSLCPSRFSQHKQNPSVTQPSAF